MFLVVFAPEVMPVEWTFELWCTAGNVPSNSPAFASGMLKVAAQSFRCRHATWRAKSNEMFQFCVALATRYPPIGQTFTRSCTVTILGFDVNLPRHSLSQEAILFCTVWPLPNVDAVLKHQRFATYFSHFDRGFSFGHSLSQSDAVDHCHIRHVVT